MLFQVIFTVFLLYLSVQNNGAECVPSEEKLSHIDLNYANKTNIRLQINDICSKVEQAHLAQIRSELSSQTELRSELMGKLKETTTFQNDVMGKLNELNEKFNKVTSLEGDMNLIRSELDRQSQFQNDVLSKLNELIKFPSSCEDVPAVNRRSGIHQIVVPRYSRDPFNVSCDEETQGGGWTTVLRREDGTVDFYLFWDDYKKGFGNLSGEFFMGLDKLHFMTRTADQELLITMEDFKGKHAFAKYDRFVIDGENEAYKLRSLGEYSGNAGDSLRIHEGKKFTTRDKDNDQKNATNCAEEFTGAWWYKQCHESNLMGRYNDNNPGKGINWARFTDYYSSLKRVQMMIRPRRDLK